MDRPLNIAHCVEHYPPAMGGMAEVVRQLSERMAARGHRVTVFTSAHADRGPATMNGVQVRSFAISGNVVEGLHGDVATYRQAVRDGPFDVITLFAAQQWTADVVLPIADGSRAKVVFVPTGFSRLHDPRYADYYRRMPHWMRAIDLNVFLSEHTQDIRFAQDHGVTNLVVIPNGAAEEEFDPPASTDFRGSLGLHPRQLVVLHVGAYTGLKGHREAIGLFVRAATNDAVLVFIGHGAHRLSRHFRGHWRYLALRLRAWLGRKRILFLEPDRAATVDAMKQADLFLFPSRVENSPLVLFESVASGVPFLASEAGNAKEIAAWTGGGWTIPGRTDAIGWTVIDVNEGARTLERLLADRTGLQAAGSRGRRAWKEKFTWRIIADRYLEHYQRLVNTAHG